ncbi:MAG: riboflavin synthase [Acholeplasmataceae bacterium]|nr:riboflavin synthase [Acholeplasmataceae bacterium]
MFTGLIAELGTIKAMKQGAKSYRLTIAADRTPRGLKLGESVAVNGACLTVVEPGEGEFTVDVMPETVRTTTIGSLKNGDRVNLEKTLRLEDGLDGHIVSGHVEGVGRIIRKEREDIAQLVTVKIPRDLTRYIIKRGSIAVDGISLTVTDVTEDDFTVSLIPHTAKETTLGFKSTGDVVNVETDVLGKYVEKMLSSPGGRAAAGLSRKTLWENGFI